MNNDEEFREYMDQEDSTNNSDLSIIISTINLKLTHMYRFFEKSLDIYKNLSKDDPLKNSLKTYIIYLIECSNQSFKQFDYIFVDDNDLENL
ncbi:hypothetical protein DRQ07_06350 [candidate division KSB1 bacterium]|nr:MAG: hypothetical protein DRQ07_06350 [candidate division KSB1 bacterium]